MDYMKIVYSLEYNTVKLYKAFMLLMFIIKIFELVKMSIKLQFNILNFEYKLSLNLLTCK